MNKQNESNNLGTIAQERKNLLIQERNEYIEKRSNVDVIDQSSLWNYYDDMIVSLWNQIRDIDPTYRYWRNLK